MAAIIPDGGPRSQEDLYVGSARELRVDTSNQELRVHDGSKSGGYRIPNIESNDQRYQARSAELDAINFRPGSAGLLTRLANGAYALRRFFWAGGIEIDEPLGAAGNITIRLGSEIPQDMTFKGDVLVEGVMQVDGGINANISGDLTGDSTGTHTGPTVGDVDVRSAELLLDANQISMSAINGLAAALLGSKMPVGTIVMWGLGVDAIPSGWYVCDGENGTPNLVNRFIYGGADDDDQFAVGGSASHSHVVTLAAAGTHSHAAEVGDFALEVIHLPSHSHGNGVVDNVTSSVFNHGTIAANPTRTAHVDDTTSGGGGIYEGLTTDVGGGTAHSHGFDMDTDGEHTHTATVEDASNLPPYVKVMYIMRVE